MKMSRIPYVLIAAAILLHLGSAQEKMTKDEWQQEISKYTKMRDDAKAKSDDLVKQMNALQAESSKLDKDHAGCLESLYALVGANTAMAEAYAAEISAAEKTASELTQLSDSELSAREGVVKDLDKKVKVLWANQLSIIPDFNKRLTALDGNINMLMSKMMPGERVFTVGTWSGDGACLWKIAEQSYADPFMWPKIWLKNKSQVKNPDIIHPGQQLTIPAAGQLTREESSAAQKYYKGKSSM